MGGGDLIRAEWPKAGAVDAGLEARMGAAFEVVRGAREVRNRYQIAPTEPLALVASFRDGELKAALGGQVEDIVRRLDSVSSVESGVNLPRRPGWGVWNGPNVTIYLGIAGHFDPRKELERAEKEAAALGSLIGRHRLQRANEAFRKAKPEMATEIETKLKEAGDKLVELKARIEELRGLL